ncbi:MAG: GIY-YIG nuclease family protein [Tissierellia bacterium]|nr:GIY-YIG nuclease family protein [Tissierellia bacterium]
MYYVYILKCSDGSLYTGCTNDLENRIKTHNAGKGAKYTRGRLPVSLVYSKKVENRSEALKLELKIKSLKRSEKFKLIRQNP